jgi:hypothetical protein
LLGNARKRHVAAAQVMSCQLEPPARQVTHRRLANQPRETIGERRARKANIAPEVVDSPLLGDAVAMAKAWYEKARNLGSAEAAVRLERLTGRDIKDLGSPGR